MMLVSCLPLWFGAVDAEAAPGDRKEFTSPRQGNLRPRRPRKKKDPYRGPFKKDRYPFQEILRPLVLPANLAELQLGLTYARAGDADGLSLGPSFAIGIGDIVEVGVGTGLSLAPDVAWSETLDLRSRVLVSDGQRFDWAPGIDVTIPTNGGPGLLTVDLGSRYLFSKRVYLLVGQGAIPIQLGQDPQVSLVGNAGLGVQLTKATVLQFDTAVARVTLGEDDTPVSGLWDELQVGATLQGTPTRPVDLALRGTLNHTWGTDAVAGTISGIGTVRF